MYKKENAAMSEHQNIATVKVLFEVFVRGDLEAVLNYFAQWAGVFLYHHVGQLVMLAQSIGFRSSRGDL
jgi:hypothetical protein